MKRYFTLMSYILICGMICFLIAEVLIRAGLFSGYFRIERIRQPGLYGGYSEDDDYWKLYYRLIGEFKPPNPRAIHPILGWSQVWVDKTNPLGLRKESLDDFGARGNKILFYGDSYVRGVADPDYEIPNYLNSRLSNARVIDLSAGGYGLDQMFLMFELTHEKVTRPYVIFGILVDDDLDRSILSVRTGQKPYFDLEDGRLALKGIPVDQDPAHYFNTNPPRIKSYSFRLIFRGVLKEMRLFNRHLAKIDKKIRINTKIIEEIQALCKRKNYPLFCVLFYGEGYLRVASWQELFLKDKLRELKIPYIDTKDSLIRYAREKNMDFSAFYVTKGYAINHHNNLGNQIIADSILKYLNSEYRLN